MRNLMQYPLTPQEVLMALDRAIEDQAAKKMIGDMTCVALHAVKAVLANDPKIVDQICAKDREQYTA